MGLVERRPNRGAIVAVVTQEHLASMFESMAELEGDLRALLPPSA